MRRINHSELRNNSSKILRELKNGESFEITNDRELVGYLLPTSLSPLEQARIASGSVPPAQSFQGFTPKQIQVPTSIDELIEWNKGER